MAYILCSYCRLVVLKIQPPNPGFGASKTHGPGNPSFNTRL